MKLGFKNIVLGITSFLCFMSLTLLTLNYLPIAKNIIKVEPVKNIAKVKEGQEVALVFIGSHKCGFCQDPKLIDAMVNIKTALKQRFANKKINFSTMGIGADWMIDESYNYLNKMGEFDEINIGRKWWNEGTHHYVWNDIQGKAATPQLLLVLRDIKTTGQYVRKETPIFRKMGSNEIIDWYKAGMPIPETALIHS